MLFKKCKSLLMDYGLGIILSHRNDRKEECPIAFASRTLTEAEKRSSQLEKKDLSITFGVEKFRQYLLGRKFVLITDNRPLIHIFSPHKPIPICASSRIKRWSLKLAAFNYTVQFRKTSDNSNVDALSRLPLESNVRESLDEDQVLLLRKSNEVPFSFMEVANETPQDKILSIVLRNVREGNCVWKFTRVPRENPLAPHYKINEELSLEFGCLQWRERVVIPKKLRSLILNDLHEIHMGIVKMKMIARRISVSEGCIGIQMVRRWRSWFLEGRQNVHDDERSGRPVTATDNAAVATVRNVMEADRRVTIDEIMIRMPPGIKIGRSSIGTIMSDVLKFRKVCARWVPRLLSENHKQQRMEAARAFLEMNRRDGNQLFFRIVTGDESWVHHSTSETKRQSMVWKKPEESAPKKAKVTISAGKVMAIVFWDCKGVLLVDYLPPNITVNAARYCEVLTKLRAAIKRKSPCLLSRKVLLAHDNARPHAARTTQTLLEDFKWEIFTHLPYSPKLAPSDFHLFPALKLHLGGKHFANDDEVQAEANHWLRRQDTAWYNSGIKKLLQRYTYTHTHAYTHANLAAARVDVRSGMAAASSSNGAALTIRKWADCDEVMKPGTDDDFTVVRTKKRRRESANSPTAAAPSSNIGGARTSRRPQSSAGSVPRAQEVRTTRAHITEARARQASSSEDHCVYLEHGPELQPFHYLRALDRMLGGTAGVIQVSKVNGHQLLGLANRGLAERLINEGLEVEGTLLRAFPFRKRNLPFFMEDSAIISALKPYGRVTSIAPKLMKAGPYTYNDGRREAFIVLREGMTTERLPTRLEIPIKGEAWPAYLSSGIKCSRCHGQGHRRANCPLLAGRANNSRLAPPTSPAGVPSTPTSAPPQRSAAQPPAPAPAPSSTAMEIPGTSHAARAISPSTAPRPSPPVAPAVPTEMAPPAPPPVTPAPSLRAPGSHEPAVPTLDIEMSVIEETSTSSTSSSKTSTREGLVTFIERNPGVSFAQTDALGLGREEVLDLLSSKTKARKRGPLLSPPQGDALASLIRQLLDLRPGGSSNIYKVLGQVRAALKTSLAAVPPTPPLPAPQPAEPAPPAPQESTPATTTPPLPPPDPMEDDDDLMPELDAIFNEIITEPGFEPLLESGISLDAVMFAVLYREDRLDLLGDLSPEQG
ncbi:hypothetical protein LAZ67_20001933, partial [Cordylochernes scorpioides]